jgi:hypothetical protein
MFRNVVRQVTQKRFIWPFVRYSDECLQKVQLIKNRRKVLKPCTQLKNDFIKIREEDKLLERAERITCYWNKLYDKIYDNLSGYFRIDHPDPDILEEIIEIGKNQGYTIQFKKDMYRKVDYVIVNDGF